MKMTWRLHDAQQGHGCVQRMWQQAKAHLTAGRVMVLTLDEAARTNDQSARFHAMVGDIARQWHKHCGQKWDAEDMKRLLVDQFYRATKDDPDLRDEWQRIAAAGRIVPSIDGTGFVQLGIQTRRFNKRLASAFIDWLFAFGAEIGVEWSDATSEAVPA